MDQATCSSPQRQQRKLDSNNSNTKRPPVSPAKSPSSLPPPAKSSRSATGRRGRPLVTPSPNDDDVGDDDNDEIPTTNNIAVRGNFDPNSYVSTLVSSQSSTHVDVPRLLDRFDDNDTDTDPNTSATSFDVVSDEAASASNASKYDVVFARGKSHPYVNNQGNCELEQFLDFFCLFVDPEHEVHRLGFTSPPGWLSMNETKKRKCLVITHMLFSSIQSMVWQLVFLRTSRNLHCH